MKYKFLRLVDGKIKSDSGNHIWELGKWYTEENPKACEHGFHCSTEPLDALSFVKGEIIAIVETKGACDKQKDKEAWQSMRIKKAYYWDKTASVKLAIFSAELVLKIYEDKYPNDDRPRKAIEAAKNYLENPTEENKNAAAYAAANAVYAVYAADAAVDAADTAYAAYAAVYAADAVYVVADAAAYAVYAAYAAAYAAYAADAVYAATVKKVNTYMKKLIKELEPYV